MFDAIKDWTYKQHCQMGSPAGSTENVKWVEITRDPTDNMYIPIRYTQFLDDHRIIVSVIKEHIEFVKDYVKLHEANLFSSEAFDDLYHYLVNQKENLRSEFERGRKQHGFMYAISDQKDLDLSKIQDSTIKFHKNTNCDIVEKYVHISQDVRSVYFGTCIDGKIVSIAACNEALDPDIQTEEINVTGIAVGTHEDYRGKGYAVSNVAALAEHHLRKGKQVTYITSVLNQASQNTAASAGFTKLAQEKIIVCLCE
jgi:RimJ/RimL family protein N-acetyltransferase